MSYLTALGCVLAIVGIVVVGGVIIAFLANTVINVFAADSRVIKDESRIEEITSAAYTEPSNTYQNVNNVTNNNVSSNASEDFDYFTEDDNSVVTDVNNAIAKEEEKLLKNESNGLKVDEKKESPLDFEDDDDFFADFNKPKETKSESKEEDDFDIMSMVDEISKDVLDDKANEVKTAKPEEKSILDNYSIDSILNNQDKIDEEDDED
ncbi:MAG: hypothetical protein IJX26_03105, partial [Clostridia bacterium]|nr:hypothetical protein [Clostridia bacterium]